MTTKTKEMEEKIVLPEEISEVSTTAPRDLVIVGQPKIGKGTILGALTRERNAVVLDLECGGYEYIAARKLSAYTTNETTQWESFQNYIKFRNALLQEKGKYEFLIVDGLSDLDGLSEIGGTLAYQNSIIGKKFNRPNGDSTANPYEVTDPRWKSVITLPEGAGYRYTRDWFMQQIEFFRQIAPYRIYAAHVADKYIKDNGKEEVIGSEISLTGKLKSIFASRVTALGKLIVEGDERYINFEVQNDSIIAGSRLSSLSGKVLISKKEKDGSITTYWNTIYKK